MSVRVGDQDAHYLLTRSRSTPAPTTHAALKSASDCLTNVIMVIEAATLMEPAGKRVPDPPGAIALSEVTADLIDALADLVDAEIDPHGEPTTASSLGISFYHGESPDHQGELIPDREVATVSFPVSASGLPWMVVAAVRRCMTALAFPPDRFSWLQQRRRPVELHRFQEGDLIPTELISLLESAAQLLTLERTRRFENPRIDELDASRPLVLADGLRIEVGKATVNLHGTPARFGAKGGDLFDLFLRLAECPNVLLSSTRLGIAAPTSQSGQASMNGRLNSKIARLRAHFKAADLEVLAKALRTQKQDRVLHAAFDWPRRVSDS